MMTARTGMVPPEVVLQVRVLSYSDNPFQRVHSVLTLVLRAMD